MTHKMRVIEFIVRSAVTFGVVVGGTGGLAAGNALSAADVSTLIRLVAGIGLGVTAIDAILTFVLRSYDR